MNNRKKYIMFGPLMVCISFVLVIVDGILFPDNHILHYIVLSVSSLLVGIGSWLLFPLDTPEPEKEKKTETNKAETEQLKPDNAMFDKKRLVMAGLMVACGVGCIWAGLSNVLPGFPFVTFGLVFIFLTTLLVMMTFIRFKSQKQEPALDNAEE